MDHWLICRMAKKTNFQRKSKSIPASFVLCLIIMSKLCGFLNLRVKHIFVFTVAHDTESNSGVLAMFIV